MFLRRKRKKGQMHRRFEDYDQEPSSARLYDLDLERSGNWLASQLGSSYYLHSSDQREPDTSDVFESTSVDDLWHRIRYGQLPLLSTVRLHNVNISEWVPISPGRSAFSYVDLGAIEPEGYENVVQDWSTAVFTPSAKESFIDAGYGCARFAPHRFGGHPQQSWMLSATTTEYPHDGVPIAVSDRDYAHLIGDIRRFGSASRTITGTLEWVPDRTTNLPEHADYTYPFIRYSEIPRVVLRVTETKASIRNDARPLVVTVAASFIGRMEGKSGFYAAFASFNSARGESLIEARDWLFNSYIRQRYDGSIVTDFDEHFPARDAGVALFRVMSGEVDLGAIKEVVTVTGGSFERGSSWSRESRLRFLNRIAAIGGYPVGFVRGDLVMGDKYDIKQAGAVGPNAVAAGNILRQQNLQIGTDLKALADALSTLREAVSLPASADEAIAYGALAEAERAAEAGDEEATAGALRRAGRWALDQAVAVGVPVATEALRRALGMS